MEGLRYDQVRRLSPDRNRAVGRPWYVKPAIPCDGIVSIGNWKNLSARSVRLKKPDSRARAPSQEGLRYVLFTMCL